MIKDGFIAVAATAINPILIMCTTVLQWKNTTGIIQHCNEKHSLSVFNLLNLATYLQYFHFIFPLYSLRARN